jgi:hypothetical protein
MVFNKILIFCYDINAGRRILRLCLHTMFQRITYSNVHYADHVQRGAVYKPRYTRYSQREVNAAASYLVERRPIQLWWFSALRDMVMKIETHVVKNPALDVVHDIVTARDTVTARHDLFTIQPRDHLWYVFRFLSTQTIARLACTNKAMRQHVLMYISENQGDFVRAIQRAYTDITPELLAALHEALCRLYPGSDYAPMYHENISSRLHELNMGDAVLNQIVVLEKLKKLTCASCNVSRIEAPVEDLTLTSQGDLSDIRKWQLTRFESTCVLRQCDLNVIDEICTLQLAVIITRSKVVIGFNNLAEAANMFAEYEAAAYRAGHDAAAIATAGMNQDLAETRQTYRMRYESARAAYLREHLCIYYYTAAPYQPRELRCRMVLPRTQMHLTIDSMNAVTCLHDVSKLTVNGMIYGDLSMYGMTEIKCARCRDVIFPHGLTALCVTGVDGIIDDVDGAVDPPASLLKCEASSITHLHNIRHLTLRKPVRITKAYCGLRSLDIPSSIDRRVLKALIGNIRVLRARRMCVGDDETAKFDELQIALREKTMIWKALL